jgi:glutathionyl-hydroquinone reductase
MESKARHKDGVTAMGILVADDPKASARATTPVLWDKAQGRIGNNQSVDIIQ